MYKDKIKQQRKYSNTLKVNLPISFQVKKKNASAFIICLKNGCDILNPSNIHSTAKRSKKSDEYVNTKLYKERHLEYLIFQHLLDRSLT